MQGQNGCDVNYGYGLVQAKAAIDMLNIHGCNAGRPDALLPGDLRLFSGCQTILPPDGPTSAPTFPPTPTPCDIKPTVLTLTLTTDNYGAETSWDLLDDNEIVRHSVPSGTYGNAQIYNENLDVCACQDYTFRIKDTFGDGICCGYGSGSYVLKNSHGVTLASGGEFDSEQTTTFTADEDGLCGSEPVPTPAHYLACGSTHTTCSGQVITASPDEFHEVRCCSDTEKSGWMKKPQCNVWGESDLPTCYHGETYASAVQICADNGARLCTVKELQDECTRGSGCGHDSDFIWTSDIATVGETGRVLIDHNVMNVGFRSYYANPVVVAFVNTRNGDDSVDVRVKDVTSSGFNIFLEEPPAFDGVHAWAEEASYIVMEKGRHTLVGGMVVEAGSHSTNTVHTGGTGFAGDEITFNTPFTSIPAVMATLNTYNNGEFMSSLTTNVRAAAFEIGQEALETGNLAQVETIGWMAFEQGFDVGLNFIAGYEVEDAQSDGVGQAGFTIDISDAQFAELPDLVVNVYGEKGPDGSYARGAGEFTATTQKVYAEEDTNKDSERNHASEPFAWVGFNHNSDLFAEGGTYADSANACRSSGEECNEGFDCCSNECLGMGTCV